MPDKNHDDFDSLFDDEPSGTPDQPADEEAFSFDEADQEPDFGDESASDESDYSSPEKKRRTSEDFAPDMDALLVTAQSPMIIEGMKYLTLQDYSVKRLSVYAEAIKGVDLFITIIQRSPKKYFKLVESLRNDIDYREVEKTAFNLYQMKFKTSPVTEDHIVRAYGLLKDKLTMGYEKSLISRASATIKKYYLLSGGLNADTLDQMIQSKSPQGKAEMVDLNKRVNCAINILKSSNPEIAKGLKGRDVNIFIIKACEILTYYYKYAGNNEASDYYKRIYNNYKKYQIIRE
ncbi:MAG: hypothetical protein JXA20_18400 [Spirochaetes bacterium]|nr:hypothetical protein [Spirochaetota bacterium]